MRVLAGKVQLGADEINRLLQQELTKQRAQAVQGARRGEIDPIEPTFQDEAPEFPEPNLSDANTRFEQEVLAVLLQIPSAWQDQQVRQICSELFATVSYNVIAQAALQSVTAMLERNWLDTIASNTPEPLHPLIRSLAAKALPIADAEMAKEYAHGVINRALKKILERSRASLISALAQTDHEANPNEHIKLQRELVALEEKIRALP
ncbi:MAG: hypothetical protein EBR26_06235 [Microbacteriaceae bacterium]|nr:hypothetical protein [Microbacteriaceae bacterium]